MPPLSKSTEKLFFFLSMSLATALTIYVLMNGRPAWMEQKPFQVAITKCAR